MLYETSQVQPSARILCTGHSLGAALAMLAAHDIAPKLKPQHRQVYQLSSSVTKAMQSICCILHLIFLPLCATLCKVGIVDMGCQNRATIYCRQILMHQLKFAWSCCYMTAVQASLLAHLWCNTIDAAFIYMCCCDVLFVHACHVS